jgi:protein-tyrosine phosphatase
MPSILFVCTANQFRSPLAAACLRKSLAREHLAQRWKVESAGTWTKNGVDAAGITIQVAHALGLEGLEGHRTRQVERELLERFDLVVVMERGHKEALCIEFPSVCRRLYLLSEIADRLPYDIPDPASTNIDPIVVGQEISTLVEKGKENMLRLAESLHRE